MDVTVGPRVHRVAVSGKPEGLSVKFLQREWQSADLTAEKGIDTVCFHRHALRTHRSSQDPAMKSFADRTNPFVMMLDPEAVISAMEQSQPLRGLAGRVCRPLDKPLIPKLFDTTIREFDAAIDAEDFVDSTTQRYVDAQPGLSKLH